MGTVKKQVWLPKHKCLDCDNLVHKPTSRCHHCAGIAMWHRRHIEANQYERINPKYCVDCGKQIKYTNTRCQHCSRINNCSLRFGPDNPSWKGERLFNKSGGYITIYRPGHPRATKYGQRVLEHIIVWEETNNKRLPKGWIIHHLNGIKTDNRIQNLIALPTKAHYLVLQAKAKRIQELEALLKGQQQLI